MAHFVIYEGIPGNATYFKNMFTELVTAGHKVTFVAESKGENTWHFDLRNHFKKAIGLPNNIIFGIQFVAKHEDNLLSDIASAKGSSTIKNSDIIVVRNIPSESKKVESLMKFGYTFIQATTDLSHFTTIRQEATKRKITSKGDRPVTIVVDDRKDDPTAITAITEIIKQLNNNILSSWPFGKQSFKDQKIFWEDVLERYSSENFLLFPSDEQKLSYHIKKAYEVYEESGNVDKITQSYCCHTFTYHQIHRLSPNMATENTPLLTISDGSPRPFNS
jgi:hypothetical protein